MNKIKSTKGITLIALVVTIVVLLILAAVSIGMLTGENGIIKKSEESKEESDIAGIKEEIQTDILGKQAENEGKISDDELNKIVAKYDRDNKIREDKENPYIITEKGYEIKVADIWNGTVKEGGDKTSVDVDKSYVGYYADINGDGQITIENDGIIYADLAVGKTGQWGNSWGDYSYSKPSATLKEYTVINEISTVDPFKTEKGIIREVSGTAGADRFYVMSLRDFTNNSKTTFYWYYNASGKLDRQIPSNGDGSNDFGKGKENTIKMLDDWNNKTSTYGKQIIASSENDYIDLWGAIQDGQYNLVGKEQDSKKWFIPSKGEWSAFGDNLQISMESSNDRYYKSLGLAGVYVTSTQFSRTHTYCVWFANGHINSENVRVPQRVRFGTTF